MNFFFHNHQYDIIWDNANTFSFALKVVVRAK